MRSAELLLYGATYVASVTKVFWGVVSLEGTGGSCPIGRPGEPSPDLLHPPRASMEAVSSPNSEITHPCL